MSEFCNENKVGILRTLSALCFIGSLVIAAMTSIPLMFAQLCGLMAFVFFFAAAHLEPMRPEDEPIITVYRTRR